MTSFKALMVSTSYPSDANDWKGLFILRLAEALARRGDIDLHLWSPPGPVPANSRLDLEDDERKCLAGLMNDGGIAHLMRTRPISGVRSAFQLLRYLHRAYRRHADASLYHVNWLQNALVLPGNGRPALLTALGTDIQLLKLPGMKALLRRAIKSRATTICPNAEWMVEPLSAAFGDIASIQYVPFGIDPNWFRIERVRDESQPERWLVVSRLTRGKLGPLFRWCQPLFQGTLRELHLFGPMQERIDVPEWVHYHGSTTPCELADRWFPQARGLITLSQHAEGRPQVMLEAMAAGVPIVASSLPAHSNMIRHGETGWLCKSSEDVAAAMGSLENRTTNFIVGKAARSWAAREIGTWDDAGERYAQIYRQLLSMGSR